MESLYLQSIIQGLTEFLPVSSSGHLLLIQYLTRFKEYSSIFIDVFLHSATFVVILVFYWKDIFSLILNFFKNPLSFNKNKILYLIFLGSIPTAIIGLIIEHCFKSVYSNVNILFITWSITAVFLIFSDKIRKIKKSIFDITIIDAIIIGTVQGIAVLPGISRSGVTIITALLLGINRGDSAKFSFLLALPAMAGAMLIEFKEVHNIMFSYNLVLSFLITFVTGYIGIIVLTKVLKRANLKFFGIYLILVLILLAIIK